MPELIASQSAIASDRRRATFVASRDDGLLPWYAISVVITTLSTFVYLAAVRRVVATGTAAPSLQAAATLLWLSGLGAPLLVLVRGAILAVTAWAVMALFDESIPYRHCLLAAWKAEPYLAAWIGVEGVIALIRQVTSQTDLLVPMGLDALWTPDTAALAIISRSVNVFFVAWLVVFWRELRRGGAATPRPRTAGLAVAAAALISIGMLVVRFL